MYTMSSSQMGVLLTVVLTSLAVFTLARGVGLF